MNALQLHREAFVIDGHSDILMPVVEGVTTLADVWPEDERARWQRIVENEQPNAETDMPSALPGLPLRTAPAGQYELPLLEQGGVTALCAAIFIRDELVDRALDEAISMVAALGRHVERYSDRCLQAFTAADLQRAKAEGKVAYILTMEGAEPVGRNIDVLDVLARLGLRMTTLTHSRRNPLADGTQMGIETGGLTRLGKEAVRRCEELGVVLDLAHMSDRGFWDAIELSTQPVVWSHTSLLTEIPGYRSPWLEVNRTYGMTKAQAIAKTGGLVGVIFWSMADTAALVAEVQAGIEHVGPEHIGIGTDFFGFDGSPREVQHAGELPRFTEALAEAGVADDAIRGVLGGNFLRVFQQVWH
jgi:membrane dipeptidase